MEGIWLSVTKPSSQNNSLQLFYLDNQKLTAFYKKQWLLHTVSLRTQPCSTTHRFDAVRALKQTFLAPKPQSVHRWWVDLQHYRFDGSSEFRITCIMAFLNSELPGSPHNFRHIQGTTNKAMRSIISQRLCLLTPAKFQLGKLRSKKKTNAKQKTNKPQPKLDPKELFIPFWK